MAQLWLDGYTLRVIRKTLLEQAGIDVSLSTVQREVQRGLVELNGPSAGNTRFGGTSPGQFRTKLPTDDQQKAHQSTPGVGGAPGATAASSANALLLGDQTASGPVKTVSQESGPAFARRFVESQITNPLLRQERKKT